jgi:hypothetical protein
MGNCEEKKHLGELVVDESVKLLREWVLKKYGVKVWIRMVWCSGEISRWTFRNNKGTRGLV